MSRVQLLCAQLPKLVIPSPSPMTFTVFPKLPRELRNKIWGYAAMVSRDIHLRGRNYTAGPYDQPEIPAILSTSREARTEGKRYYTLCRELKKIRDPNHYDRCLNPRLRSAARICSRNTVWINFDVDEFIFLGILESHRQRKHYRISRPIDVTDELCFKDDIIGRIQRLSLVLKEYETSSLSQYLLYLSNLLRNEPLEMLSISKVYMTENSEPGLLDFDLEKEGEELKMQGIILREQEERGWKVPFETDLRLSFWQSFFRDGKETYLRSCEL